MDKGMRKNEEEALDTLDNCIAKWDEVNPGLVFEWNEPTTTLFVATANNYVPKEYRPAWISTVHGQMTPQSLKNDITEYAASVGGKRCYGGVFIGPNAPDELGRITAQLSRLEVSRYLQDVMAAPIGTSISGSFYLAKLAIVEGKTCKIPLNWPPSSPAPDEIIPLFL